MSGKVVAREETSGVSTLLTNIGKRVLPVETDSTWYVVTGIAVCVLGLAVVITALCLISKFSRKRRKK